MTQRNIVYIAGTSVPVSTIVGTAFTHAVLSACHLNQNPAMTRFRILANSSDTLFRAGDFSSWVPSLDQGHFPASLRTHSRESFIRFGKPLSDNVTVTTVTAGQSWSLLDNANGYRYAMQVDPKGTYVSFNGGSISDAFDDYSGFEKSLDAGTFPPALRSSAKLPPNSDYKVTQVPNQTNGKKQWRITNTSNGYLYFVWILTDENTGNLCMKVMDLQYVFSANLFLFMTSLLELPEKGIPILASFGGGGVAEDWRVLREDLDQSRIVILEFLDAFGISGIDYDWEMPGSPYTDADIAAMTALTNAMRVMREGLIFTICPYNQGPKIQTVTQLLRVWKNVGFNSIAWANCQNYSDSEAQKRVTENYLTPISNEFAGILPAASAAAPYISIGFTAENMTAQKFAEQIQYVAQEYSTLGGAFTYHLEDITGSPKDWASAVADALQGK